MDKTRTSSNNRAFIDLPEPELIEAAGRGDLMAFNRLILGCQDEIYTLVYHLAPARADVQAITQTMVQRMYHELPGFQGGDFRLWAYKELAKICREAWRSEQAEVGRRWPWKKNGAVPARGHSPSTGRPVENYRFDGVTGEEGIKTRLDELPFEQRLAVTLVDVLGLDYQGAADVLGASRSEIRSRLATARRRLSWTWREEMQV
jgi:RNA polymerase sigma-70 factor (ECF subfamily)